MTDERSDRFGSRSRDRADGHSASTMRDEWSPGVHRLYLDPSRRRLAGVCAGVARYYDVEPWVVRLIAVTGLLFLPGIVFPAYWVAYFLMERPPRSGDAAPRPWGQGRRLRTHGLGRRDQYSSPAPELGPRFSPRLGLRDVKADLTEVELRLRRMEAHVTSGRYELQRELHKIDPGAGR